jgi:hypothetical protein
VKKAKAKVKSKPPIKQKYFTPEQVQKMWEEYKLSVDNDPDVIEEVTAKGVVIRRVKKPYLRQGFEAFVIKKTGSMIGQYLDNQDGAYGSYLEVVTHIRREWESDQIAGTMTGRYKAPNLTARLCNLAEKQETKTDGIQKIIVEYSSDHTTETP